MKPRLLLVGADQIEPGEWRTAECTGIYDPWGFVPTDSEIPLLSEPEFDPRRYDGVVFCIPNYKKTPAQLIADALQAGLPVLAVKMRLDGLSGLAPVRELPRELRDRFWIGEHYRFQPGALAVRTAVAEGRIGRVEYVSMRCTLPMPQRSPWMDAYRHLILEDLAYHHMTVIEGICGGLVGSVFAQSWQPSWMVDRGYAAFLLHADSGWRMLYETRWGSAEPGSNFFGEIVAEGALGQVWTDGSKAVLTARDGKSMQLETSECAYANWSGTVDQFGGMLCAKAEPDAPEPLPFDRFDGILRMMYAAVDSAQSGQPVRFA